MREVKVDCTQISYTLLQMERRHRILRLPSSVDLPFNKTQVGQVDSIEQPRDVWM